MDLDHVHFYLSSSRLAQAQFQYRLGLTAIGAWSDGNVITILWQRDLVYLLTTSPQDLPLEWPGLELQCPKFNHAPDLNHYLGQHPSGVVDLALRVTDLKKRLAQIPAAYICHPLQTLEQESGGVHWAVIQGWGGLRHTLVERWGSGGPFSPWYPVAFAPVSKSAGLLWGGLDHGVLNVSAAEFKLAQAWYQNILGFCPEQTFEIHTAHSGLVSQVLHHPEGTAQLPINAPTSATSQIQYFLEQNHGSGIQHLAWATPNIFGLVEDLRQRGLEFLPIPPHYYDQVPQRVPAAAHLLPQARHAQILIDSPHPTSEQRLLQIFSQPVFERPTFFWELIERQHQAPGFGAGNFQALFEAVEQQQSRSGLGI